ncbi:MAG: hypothetical protein AB7L84_07795 [Acidimicrobiia bacterium]
MEQRLRKTRAARLAACALLTASSTAVGFGATPAGAESLGLTSCKATPDNALTAAAMSVGLIPTDWNIHVGIEFDVPNMFHPGASGQMSHRWTFGLSPTQSTMLAKGGVADLAFYSAELPIDVDGPVWGDFDAKVTQVEHKAHVVPGKELLLKTKPFVRNYEVDDSAPTGTFVQWGSNGTFKLLDVRAYRVQKQAFALDLVCHAPIDTATTALQWGPVDPSGPDDLDGCKEGSAPGACQPHPGDGGPGDAGIPDEDPPCDPATGEGCAPLPQ